MKKTYKIEVDCANCAAKMERAAAAVTPTHCKETKNEAEGSLRFVFSVIPVFSRCRFSAVPSGQESWDIAP